MARGGWLHNIEIRFQSRPGHVNGNLFTMAFPIDLRKQYFAVTNGKNQRDGREILPASSANKPMYVVYHQYQ